MSSSAAADGSEAEPSVQAEPAPEVTEKPASASGSSSTKSAPKAGGTGKKIDSLIPKGSVKRVIKLDKDVRLVGTDAVTAISKSTEMFIEWFARKAADEAKRRVGEDGKTIIKYEDVYQARTADKTLEFLDGIVPPPHYVQK